MFGERMEAVIMDGPRQAAVRQIGVWVPEPGEVLVRCRYAAICTTERKFFAGGKDHRMYPVIGGHEVSGEVTRVADGVRGLAPGDHVALDAVRRCGACHYCLRGQDHLCLDMTRRRKRDGFTLVGGGFAQYTVVPAERAVKLAHGVSLAQASLIEPLACCLHSVDKARVCAGETVLVLGAGPMGALHACLARLRGAEVIVAEIDRGRQAYARRLGAEVLELDANRPEEGRAEVVERARARSGGRGADAVFVTANSREAGELGLAALGKLGRLVLYSSTRPPVDLALDWNRVHYEEVEVLGSQGKTAREFVAAAEMVDRGEIDLKAFVSRTIPLAQLPAELAATPAGELQRVVVEHDGAR